MNQNYSSILSLSLVLTIATFNLAQTKSAEANRTTNASVVPEVLVDEFTDRGPPCNALGQTKLAAELQQTLKQAEQISPVVIADREPEARRFVECIARTIALPIGSESPRLLRLNVDRLFAGKPTREVARRLEIAINQASKTRNSILLVAQLDRFIGERAPIGISRMLAHAVATN